MKKFKLMKWIGMGMNAEPSEFVVRGSLKDIVNYANENGLNWHELPNHLVGGYFTKSIDVNTADAFEVIPVGG